MKSQRDNDKKTLAPSPSSRSMASSYVKGVWSGVRRVFGRGESSTSASPTTLGPELDAALQEVCRTVEVLRGTKPRIPGVGVPTNDDAVMASVWRPFYAFDEQSM
jgi:hypothetical protein